LELLESQSCSLEQMELWLYQRLGLFLEL